MKKTCRFIRKKEAIYVPFPTSWLEGWTRQRWLERYFKKEENIRSVDIDAWEKLKKQNKVYILTEDNGKFHENPLS